MNFKNILFFCVFLYTAPFAPAQNEETGEEDLSKLSFRERLSYNISGGFWVGTVTNISVLPQVGYRITPRLTSGIGGNLFYYRDNRYTGNNQFLIYGGNAFTRFKVTPEIFTQVEYQALAYRNTLGHYVLLGGGYMPGNGIYISAYYLLLYPPNNNIYVLPYVLRIGYAF